MTEFLQQLSGSLLASLQCWSCDAIIYMLKEAYLGWLRLHSPRSSRRAWLRVLSDFLESLWEASPSELPVEVSLRIIPFKGDERLDNGCRGGLEKESFSPGQCKLFIQEAGYSERCAGGLHGGLYVLHPFVDLPKALHWLISI